VLLQIPKLVTPLRQDPQRVLEKGDDDKKAADSRQVGLQRLRVDRGVVLDLLAECLQFFHGVVGVG